MITYERFEFTWQRTKLIDSSSLLMRHLLDYHDNDNNGGKKTLNMQMDFSTRMKIAQK